MMIKTWQAALVCAGITIVCLIIVLLLVRSKKSPCRRRHHSQPAPAAVKVTPIPTYADYSPYRPLSEGDAQHGQDQSS